MWDKGMGVRGRGEGGEGGEEMAWGRGGTHDRGRVELTRVVGLGNFGTCFFVPLALQKEVVSGKGASSNGLK